MQSKNQENCDKKAIRLDKEIEKNKGSGLSKLKESTYQDLMILLNTKQVCLVINFDLLLIYQKNIVSLNIN